MISFKQVEILKDKCLNDLSKVYKTKIVQTKLREFDLGYILYYNTETCVLSGSHDVFLGDGCMVIDKNDGSIKSVSIHPVQAFGGITVEDVYKKEKYGIPIENEQEKLHKFMK
ncbi:hypothetical protein V9L05_13040 [Bernardetia sp. Wsw4-3y2]|uniref:hypothetical protein n=1 Tax=Bernardetia sp. Wsw4-3y2 TaxID=3127471 RepID=UPI0030D62578